MGASNRVPAVGAVSAPGAAFAGRVFVADWALATLRPTSDAGPAPTPSSASPSWKPARTRETSLKLQTLDAVSYTHLTLPTNREV